MRTEYCDKFGHEQMKISRYWILFKMLISMSSKYSNAAQKKFWKNVYEKQY